MKAIIIGATSGIGRELAVTLAQHGYTLGLAGRRQPLLAELQHSLPTQVFVQPMDVADHMQAMDLFARLIEHMGGVDLVVISAGTGFLNPELSWSEERTTIDVNVTGFAAMANVAFRHFMAAGSGHLVGISSIAALRGSHQAPAYSASKAFMSNYLEALRWRAVKAGLPITVTDIQPGFVATRMAQGDGLFWVATPPGSSTPNLSGHCVQSQARLHHPPLAPDRLAVAPPARCPSRQDVVPRAMAVAATTTLRPPFAPVQDSACSPLKKCAQKATEQREGRIRACPGTETSTWKRGSSPGSGTIAKRVLFLRSSHLCLPSW